MSFDWIRFLEQNRIEYRTSGANVSRNHVVVHCPFCGSQDPSMHMSISLEGKGWRCWRNNDHRGKSPVRLVQNLIGCTTHRATQIVGVDTYVPSNTDLIQQVRQLFDDPPPKPKPPKLKIPSEFKAFEAQLPSSRPYVLYLQERGFSLAEIRTFTKWRDVYYCTRGPYKGRIIFTVWQDGQLVTWTGRTISRSEDLRYKALSSDPDKAREDQQPLARGPISEYLLWYDELCETDCETLILVEGPFDALKINVLGSARYGICSTCFFTSRPSEKQIDLLHTLCPRFRRCVLLLDAGTYELATRTASRLACLGVVVEQMPPTISDPGEFVDSTFNNFALALERRLS